MDTWTQLEEYRDLTDEAIKKMKTSGIEAAKKDRDYKRALAKRELILRTEGKIPASMIKQIAEGDETVSEIKFALDCAEVIFKADYEAVLSYKKRADDLREQHAREWADAKNEF